VTSAGMVEEGPLEICFSMRNVRTLTKIVKINFSELWKVSKGMLLKRIKLRISHRKLYAVLICHMMSSSSQFHGSLEIQQSHTKSNCENQQPRSWWEHKRFRYPQKFHLNRTVII
jgi:hypothetical protein